MAAEIGARTITAHYKPIAARVSVDGVGMINSGNDNSTAIVSSVTMRPRGAIYTFRRISGDVAQGTRSGGTRRKLLAHKSRQVTNVWRIQRVVLAVATIIKFQNQGSTPPTWHNFKTEISKITLSIPTIQDDGHLDTSSPSSDTEFARLLANTDRRKEKNNIRAPSAGLLIHDNIKGPDAIKTGAADIDV
ncbi:hypothetical protein EVAR_48531_1 [Eumeta japonica]|uniref:Uncharacterized protein n=1 Tax=Eumeta variegata TaxID=151549 RepID=A0A4C1Y804_EUMVA|nr:hypothetical protein EVAR_48531_1 [Eumeta japonica]